MGTKIISQTIQVSRGTDRLGKIFYGSPAFTKEMFDSIDSGVNIDAMNPVLIRNKFKNIKEDEEIEKPYLPIIICDIEEGVLKTVDYYSLGEATCIQYSGAECYTALDYIKNAVFVGDVVKLTFDNGIAIGDICKSPTTAVFSGVLITNLPVEDLENTLSVASFNIPAEGLYDLCENKSTLYPLGNIVKVEKVSDVLTKGCFRFIFNVVLDEHQDSFSIRVLSEEIIITHFGISLKDIKTIMNGSKDFEDMAQTLIDLYLTQ